MYNDIVANCNFPKEWRFIKITPIPKKDKDLTYVENFRSISLITVMAKTVNSLVKVRLKKFTKKNKVLPYRSYSYQKGKSESMCINDVINVIVDGRCNGLSACLSALAPWGCVDRKLGHCFLRTKAHPQWYVAPDFALF